VDRISRSSYEPEFPAWQPERGLVDRDDRHVSLYRVGALTVAGRRELCVVRNVSAGGLMLTAYSAIEPGARIAVEFKQGESVHGVVAWSDGSNVGVRFDEPVDVAAILANPADGLRPRMPRIGIESRITVREGDNLHQVRALDISQGGVCIESSAQLPIGADVVVRLEGLPPEGAVVRWRNGDCYGLGFNRLLSVPSLAAWLRENRDGGSAEAKA
jgi:hypothetical protein